MSKIPKLTQPLTSARKNEILNQLYINAFEFFKKNSSRKDKKNQEIKEACILLKDPQNFSSPSQIKKYSLLFAQPLENINLKILEKILLVLEEVIMNNLVDNDILYEMIEIIFAIASKNVIVNIVKESIRSFSHIHIVGRDTLNSPSNNCQAIIIIHQPDSA